MSCCYQVLVGCRYLMVVKLVTLKLHFLLFLQIHTIKHTATFAVEVHIQVFTFII